ncbi:trigger factor [Sanguibacter gelidistatuariae]|uniref:Trigger factor n=1 Tax=Sanguibacter gelidistatuariae TaxID=1814289 RepID=A0A1G6NBT9_9MICO|nr:trigger factor [Sanguibacter gelidistatuariae]
MPSSKLEIIEVKSAVETLDPTKVKLTVEVEYDELKPSIDHAYKHIAEQISVPGFRKGKVPARIVDQRVGRGAVLEHAINESLSGFYRQAVTQTNIRPLGQPDVQVIKVPDLEGTDGELHFTAEVEVRPEVELPELSAIKVAVEDVTVSDEDVAARLDALRERFGTLVGVDRPAVDGDFVVLDLSAKVDGEEVDTVSGISYQIGSGNMLEGLDEALTGLSAGETTTFVAPLAGGEHEGQDADVTVVATTVKQRDLPEADDEFAQLASEFDTLAELTEDLREQAANIKQSNQAVQARDLLLAELTKVEVPLPAGVVEAEIVRHLEGEGRLEDAEHRAEVLEQTETALKNQIVLDILAEKLAIKVGQNELLDYLVNASRQYGMDPNTFIKTIDENGQIPAMVGEVARSKALAVALRQVEVVDGEGNAVDLSEFIGSDEDDAAVEAAGVAVVESDDVVEVVVDESAEAPADADADEKA